MAEPADVGKGIYELYVEPVEKESPVVIPEDKESEITPPLEVKKNVADSRGRDRKK